MGTVERTASIGAPVADVWQALADFGSIATWAPNVDHSCLLTDRAGGVGAVRRIQAGRITLRETVEAWEPDTGLSYRITGLPPAVRSVTNTWRLRPSGDATTVTITSHVDCGPRPRQRLIATIVGRRMASASDRMIAGLTDACERPVDEAARPDTGRTDTAGDDER